MPLPLSAHSFHIAGGSCLLAAHVSNRLVSLLASPCVPTDGAGGCVVRACLLPYSHAVGLCGSPPLLAWRGGWDGVRRMKKKRTGVFVFPVRLLLCLYDVVFALVVVVHEAWLTVAYFNKEMLFRNIRKALYTSECK